VVIWRKIEVAQDDGRVEGSLVTKISSREEGPDFDLVGTLRKVVVRKTRGATCMTCYHVLPPCRMYNDSNYCDTLEYEWPLARCCHLVVYLDG
jgi:hypothetical protein